MRAPKIIALVLGAPLVRFDRRFPFSAADRCQRSADACNNHRLRRRIFALVDERRAGHR